MLRTLSRLLTPVALAATMAALSGCYIDTQRFPNPMPGDYENLPEGASDIFKAGPEEALVMRISDPVFLRRPGESSSFPVHFFRKRVRIGAGYWVLSEAGGRVDLFFGRGAELSLSGNNTIVLGSPSRGEPMVAFLEIENARLSLSANEYVELLGGALLSGDGGPFVIAHGREEVLELSNRSPNPGTVRYRDETIELQPGETLHMPLLGAGNNPREPGVGFQSVDAAGSRLGLRGSLRILESDDRHIELVADGEHEIRAKGVVVRLDKGDKVEFDDLSAKP
ncbi:MAG: hypothetical protein H6830_03655 [Planctomycetes bacterium]|nr:hypothetical protein [Planctomycetota bacterium]HPF15501.1 hypothetical protein [Planctomycetota bacterium]HRV80639.1 hypothetical protein [Planctomycetota bacterium]